MATRITHTSYDDAPLSTAKNPDPAAAGLALDSDDAGDLVGRTITINRPRQQLYDFWRERAD